MKEASNQIGRSKVRRLAPALAALALAAGLAVGGTVNPAANHSAAAAARPSMSLQAGQTVYALTVSGLLVQFNADSPCTILSELRVSGLLEGETLLGIDFRPATGQLYGLGSSSQLYVIDPATAVATPVGTAPFTPALQGSSFGFDFNPTVDRIRVVSDTGQNLRLNPVTGAVAAVDIPLAYATGDQNAGAQPLVAGAAYTNPDNNPATGTTLYDIDAALDILTIQNPPNNGTLNTVGPLGVNTNVLVGFDITLSGGTNVAYAALKVGGKSKEKGKKCGNSNLVRIDLSTGAATNLGPIGTQQPIIGLAVPTQ